MPRYRNRPDRRVIRETPIQIQPIADYTATFLNSLQVRCVFTQPMLKLGDVVSRLVNVSGGIVAPATSIVQVNPTTFDITYGTTINTESRVFFFEQNQSTLRGTTGAVVSAAPRFILAD